MSLPAVLRTLRWAATAALTLLIVGALTSTASTTGEPAFPYDEAANAETDVAVATAAANDHGRFLLINFGANWCPDCRALAAALAEEPLASIIDKHFVMVKVDVGNWDKHQALVKRYGDPIANGIPAIAVVDRTGAVRYTTRAGELSTARNMGTEELQGFFEELIALLQTS